MNAKFYYFLFFLILFFLAFEKTNAQAPGWQWAKGMGGGGGYVLSRCVAVDPGSGAIYTTGEFSGTIDFDPGSDTFNLTALGGHNIFISKFSGSGNFIWAKSMGGTDQSAGLSIAIDPARGGDIYTTGFFSGTVDFNPGTGILNISSIGNRDQFISKLDDSGNFVWARTIGGTDSYVNGNSITVDPINGDIYTTGNFTATVDFDPGSITFNLTSVGASDIFISKLDASGNFIWAKAMGGPLSDDGTSIKADPSGSGDVYTTGYFSGTADFNPDGGTFNLTSNGDADIFITKLDGSGNFIWAKSIGGIENDKCHSIIFDTEDTGRIYTTGEFRSTVDFDPGAGIYNLTSVERENCFISKLDADGNFIWAKAMSGNSAVIGYSIAIDHEGTGGVYTTGEFAGTIDFDPGPGVYNLSAPAYLSDIFISKLDSSGNLLWAIRIGGNNNDVGYSIALDTIDNTKVYTTGTFSETVDFDPGPDSFDITASGDEDIFISRLNSEGHFGWALSIEGKIPGRANALDMANDPLNNNVYTTGYFTGTVDFDPGPDTFCLTAIGNPDIFISKLDSVGNFLWAITIGGVGEANGNSIAVDPVNGDIYTTGYFIDTIDFDPGPGIFNLTAAGFALFISKLDSAGHFIWAKVIGEENYNYCTGRSLSLDDAGNIYLTGSFTDYVDFDPGAGVYNLYSEFGSGFISKYDSSGHFIWATSMGGWGEAEGISLTVESGSGNIYATGDFQGECTFGTEQGASSYTTWPEFDRDVFISKLNSSGHFMWTKRIGGSYLHDYAYAIAVDPTRGGSVYTTGYFQGTADFDPNSLDYLLTSNGASDIFISKLDSLGSFVWAKSMGESFYNSGTSIIVDPSNGSVYTSGYFAGTVDFDPGPDTFYLTGSNFISKLDGSGHFIWAKSVLGFWLNSIDLNSSGHLIDAGSFDIPTLLFDSTAVINTGAWGSPDIFVAKLGGCAGIVTTTADSGFGSLRDVISCVESGHTISFSLEPMSQITLTSGEILINKNLTLAGPGKYDLTISGNNASRIFNLPPGKIFHVKDLSLKNATSVTNGGAIFTKGNLTLENVLFQNNFQNGIPKGMTIFPGALITMIGNVEFNY